MKPHLINFHDLLKTTSRMDYHIHTTFTDGADSVEDYIRAGVELGLEAIVFTEHVRKSSDWYFEYVETIETLRSTWNDRIAIFHGIEAKVLNTDGELDASDEMLDTAELVLGSVHRFPGHDGAPMVVHYRMEEDEFAATELSLAKAILKNPDVDVLAHPGGMFIRKFKKDLPSGFMEELVSNAVRYSGAIEINSSYLKDITLDTEPFSRMNPRVSPGSDAHRKEDLGAILAYLKTIRKNGIS